MDVTVVGVPFNSAGLTDGVASAALLSRAGLRPGRRLEVADAGDVRFAPPAPQRSPASGLLAERALVSMVAGTREAVAAVHQAGRFRWSSAATARSCWARWPLPGTATARSGC